MLNQVIIMPPKLNFGFCSYVSTCQFGATVLFHIPWSGVQIAYESRSARLASYYQYQYTSQAKGLKPQAEVGFRD